MTNINKAVLATTLILSFIMTGCSDSDGSSSSSVNNPETKPVVDPYKSAGWYAKTEVSARVADGTVYSHKTAGVFGELVQSDDDRDQHDIAGFGPAKLQVVFAKPEWGDNNGYFFSDYRAFDNAKKVWTFQVLNTYVENHPKYGVDLANAPITLNLNGVYDVAYRDDRGSVEYRESKETNQTLVDKLTLVDVDNCDRYTVEQLSTATLNMDGSHTRTFRWVLGTEDGTTDCEPLPAPQRSAGRTATSAFEVAPVKSSGGKFGLPPQ